jgi:ABC-type multidrug transport system fused ATPase/permease subunit
MSLLAAHLARHRLRLAAVAVLVLVSGAAVAAVPPIVRYGIDDGMSAGDAGALRVAALALLGVIGAGGLAAGLRTAQMGRLAQDVLHGLRADALGGVLRLDLGAYERRDRGDLQARVTGDVGALTDATTDFLPQLTAQAVAVAGGFAAIAILSPGSALIALAAVPPVAIAGRWLARRSAVVYPEHRRRLAVVTGHAVETVEGAVTLQAYRAEEPYRRRLRAADEQVIDAVLAGTRMRNRFYPALTVVQAGAAAAVVVYASLRALDGAMTIGTASAVLLAVGAALAPLIQLSGMLDAVFAARAALTRVAELAATPPPPAGERALPARGELRLEDVGFAYVQGRPVLHGLTLTVGPGERVALVGATGSGKSTITRVATGLAVPSHGRATFGGVALSDATASERARRLLLLPQETFLLDGTVADNLRLAAPGAGDEDLRAAARAMGVADWLDALPAGLETPVGERGERLSAGERQLVSLLRVVVADPAVVALDEATSLLDADTERRVGDALARALDGRAVLVVAHRRETAARCDRIALVDAGRLVAVGTDAELARGEAGYRRLWPAAPEDERG